MQDLMANPLHVLHVLTVPLAGTDDWERAEQLLLAAGREECASFLEDARVHMARAGSAEGLPPPNVDPRVILRLPEPGRVHLLLRFPAPVRQRGLIEQAILRRFLGGFEMSRAQREQSKV